MPHVARALGEGFTFQGEISPHRKGEVRGEPTWGLPATAFVNFLQNHDQIGNRALGERMSELAPVPALDAALTIMLLAPGPPLMFMGEEWAASEPFPFFCDFKGSLAEAVRAGRRKEFAEAYARHHDEVPDPLSEQTVRKATLNWSAIGRPPHRDRLDLVRRLLAARMSFVIPRLPRLQNAPGRAELNDGMFTGQAGLSGSGESPLDARPTSRDLARIRPRRSFAARHADLGWRTAFVVAAVVGLCGDRSLIVVPDIPLATYRLQLTKDFDFDDAARAVPYLKSLGITHVYTSPFLKARPGSLHGYDVVDHRLLNLPNLVAKTHLRG